MLQIIKNIIMDYVDITEEEITAELNPFRDLSLNSYDYINIIGKLESELGVKISERDIRKMETLGDLDKYLKSKLQD